MDDQLTCSFSYAQAFMRPTLYAEIIPPPSPTPWEMAWIAATTTLRIGVPLALCAIAFAAKPALFVTAFGIGFIWATGMGLATRVFT